MRVSKVFGSRVLGFTVQDCCELDLTGWGVGLMPAWLNILVFLKVAMDFESWYKEQWQSLWGFRGL